jgi:hypothetical protein
MCPIKRTLTDINSGSCGNQGVKRGTILGRMADASVGNGGTKTTVKDGLSLPV